jgi:hypothetical protein
MLELARAKKGEVWKQNAYVAVVMGWEGDVVTGSFQPVNYGKGEKGVTYWDPNIQTYRVVNDG